MVTPERFIRESRKYFPPTMLHPTTHSDVDFPEELRNAVFIGRPQQAREDLETPPTVPVPSSVPKAIILTVCLALDHLVENHPMHLVELIDLARTPGTEIDPEALQSGMKFGLVDTSGNLHNAVRHVIRAAAVGTGLDIRIRTAGELLAEREALD